MDGPDLLSALPSEIINVILAILPIRDAVRTCILSKKWKDKWTRLPHLSFKEIKPNNLSSEAELKHERGMDSFISSVIRGHKGPIDSFRVSYGFEEIAPNFAQWVMSLSRLNIRELILDHGRTPLTIVLDLQCSIYSCTQLTHLKLYRAELIPPPRRFQGFLYLKSLILERVESFPSVFRSLFANSPLLEKLVILNCDCKNLKIDAPNLKNLSLGQNSIRSKLLIINAPLLEYLSIHLYERELCLHAPLVAEISVVLYTTKFTAKYQGSTSNYINFFGNFTKLEKLTGSFYFAKYLTIGIESCHNPLVYHYLKDIDLAEVEFGDVKEMSIVARIVIGAPNLENLRIANTFMTSRDDASTSEAHHLSFTDLGCPPNFKLEKMRVLIMAAVTGNPLEMELVKFLLKSSPFLEKMILGPRILDIDEVEELKDRVKEFASSSVVNFSVEMNC